MSGYLQSELPVIELFQKLKYDYFNANGEMKHPLYTLGEYKIKLLYIVSEDIFHQSALHYAREHSDIVECQVMPIQA